MRLETERLVLRRWTAEDAAALYALASDPEIGPRCGWKPHESEAESAEIIRTVFAAPEVYAVTLREGGKIIGSAGLQPMEGQPDDSPELGYWLGRAYWGRGLMPEAARSLIDRAFEELNVRELWCSHFASNAQSRRVIEKCGFRYRMTKERAGTDGVAQTTLFYALTRRDWEAAR